MPADLVLDPLQLNPTPSHFFIMLAFLLLISYIELRRSPSIKKKPKTRKKEKRKKKKGRSRVEEEEVVPPKIGSFGRR